MGVEQRACGVAREVLVAGDQQLFLVRVEAVERGRGYVGETGEVGDAHGGIALLRDQLDHRGAQAAALVDADLLGVEPVASGWERLEALGARHASRAP